MSFCPIKLQSIAECLNTYQCDQSQLLFVFLCFCEICRTDLLRAGLTTAACCALEERGEKMLKDKYLSRASPHSFCELLGHAEGEEGKVGGDELNVFIRAWQTLDICSDADL